MNKKKLGKYAFWKYDRVPYVLGGTITDILDDGRVETREYGKGYYFTPIKIVPIEDGLKIQDQLNAMKEQREVLLSNIYELTDGKVMDKFPFFFKK